MSDRDFRRGPYGIRRESFGDFFGQERRPEPDYDRDSERRRSRRFDLDRDRDHFGPRGIEGNYGGREGWPGYGSEGDWEGYYGREGGYERGMNWGAGGDYGRGADWGPVRRGRYGNYGGYGGHGNREEGFNRGQGRRGEAADWGNWGSRDYWEDYGWGRNWPESRFREGYDWENQRQGGYGASSGYGRTGQFAGRGPRGYQRSDDRIKEDVNDRLTEHGDIDASDVEVDVQNGEVTLRGTVDSRHAKRLAEDIADSVSGVRDVRNELRVQRQAWQMEQSQAA